MFDVIGREGQLRKLARASTETALGVFAARTHIHSRMLWDTTQMREPANWVVRRVGRIRDMLTRAWGVGASQISVRTTTANQLLSIDSR
ncbi:hypothetical protein GCM10009749_24970 [Agromyces neolithicus]|uniref:Uncharacterized protein n=1 Tax=Agromyces neolithicus TaxID=269420 RepID=A0ABN2M8D6_9MICO